MFTRLSPVVLVSLVGVSFFLGCERIKKAGNALLESGDTPNFSIGVRGGLDDYRLVITLEEAKGELKNVHATLTLTSVSGDKSEPATHVWDSWKKGDSKTVSISAMTIKAANLKGTAMLDGSEVSFDANFSWGTDDHPYPMPRLEKFTLKGLRNGSTKVVLAYSGGFEIKNVDAVVTVTTKGGVTKPPFKVNRPTWLTGEEVEIDLAETTGERVTLKGTATVQGKSVRIDVSWGTD